MVWQLDARVIWHLGLTLELDGGTEFWVSDFSDFSGSIFFGFFLLVCMLETGNWRWKHPNSTPQEEEV